MARVYLPPAMRELANGQEFLESTGVTVLQVICELDRRFPGFKQRVCENDELRPGLAVVINGSASSLGVLQRVESNAEIHFLPAIGGG